MKQDQYQGLKNSWGYGNAPDYSIEIEVIEGDEVDCHRVGDKFEYPKDRGIMCPWLLGSMSSGS